MSGSLATAAAFVAVAAARSSRPDRLLTPGNLLTLSRAGSAGLLAGAAAAPGSRRAGRAAWLGLIFGATVADWLDGPLARRRPPSRLGAMLDLEADSWLTLWAAVAAYRRGALAGWCLVPPAGRYLVLLLGRRAPAANRPWQQAAGVAQMAVLAGALAPWPAARRMSRGLAPLAGAAQLSALAAEV